MNSIAWAAGLFDGEGSTSNMHQTLRISIGQHDPEVLLHFQRAVGAGDVRGPYDGAWQYTIHGISNVQYVLGKIWPWLSEQKKAQAQHAVYAWVLKDRRCFQYRPIVELQPTREA